MSHGQHPEPPARGQGSALQLLCAPVCEQMHVCGPACIHEHMCDVSVCSQLHRRLPGGGQGRRGKGFSADLESQEPLPRLLSQLRVIGWMTSFALNLWCLWDLPSAGCQSPHLGSRTAGSIVAWRVACLRSRGQPDSDLGRPSL